MKVELKAIKYCKELSRETLAFVGKLYVNGKHIADAENDGHGACTNLQPVTKWTKEGVPSVDLYIKEALDEFNYWAKENCEYGAEQVVDDLVIDELHWRDFQSLKRKKLLYFKPDEGEHGSIFSAGGNNSKRAQEFITKVAWWKHEYVVLNNVKKAEFFSKYLSAWAK